MASFDLSSYFLRSSSPLVTCMSSRGLPIAKSWYDGVDMVFRLVWEVLEFVKQILEVRDFTGSIWKVASDDGFCRYWHSYTSIILRIGESVDVGSSTG